MPLYELLIISRCGEAKGTANLFRQMALTIFERGGESLFNLYEKNIKNHELYLKKKIMQTIS